MADESVALFLADKLLTFAVALLGALIGVGSMALANGLQAKQWYSQRWWERKADSYSRVIEQLSTLVYAVDAQLRAEYHLGGMDTDRAAALDTERRSAIDKLERITSQGAYTISETALDALDGLMRFYSNTPPYDYNEPLNDYIQREVDAIQACIDTVRREAKRELAG